MRFYDYLCITFFFSFFLIILLLVCLITRIYGYFLFKTGYQRGGMADRPISRYGEQMEY